jgi:hypothetical protein
MTTGSGSAGPVAPTLTNTVRAANPNYRIRLELGDLDAVFDPVNSILGKKQRLQALGFYYEIFSAADAANATEAYTQCLRGWQDFLTTTEALALADDAAIENQLRTRIRQFVVEDNHLPASGEEKKILLPGAYTFTDPPQLGAEGTADGTALTSHRYNDETNLWNGNPKLGLIPLIATVEMQQEGGSWAAAPNLWVHFQLIPPFFDNAAGELADVQALRNQSEQGTATATNVVPNVGPRPFITNAQQHNFDANDPQRYNTHQSRGGKRGMAVLTNLMDSLPNAAFPNMNAVQNSARPHAVKAQTNGQGKAGILFKPSRMGGDRYRFRVFLDPIGSRASDGTEANAVKFETGRFTVWKHILWFRFLRKPLPALPASNTLAGVQARLSILGYDTGPVDGILGGRTRGAVRAFQGNNHPPLSVNENPNDANTQAALDAEYQNYLTTIGQSLGNLDFAYAQGQFLQFYCQLEIAQAQIMQPMTEEFYLAAFRWARDQAQANQNSFALGQRYNLLIMFPDYFQTPFLFDIAHPREYNRKRGAGYPQASNANDYLRYWRDAALCIYARNGLLDLFMRYFNGNASPTSAPNANINRYSSPGLTVVRSITASRLMFAPNQAGQVQIPNNIPASRASGIARAERGCYVFYGTDIYQNWPYQGDGYSKNTLHEFGHTLYLRHHFTSDPTDANAGTHGVGDFREDHDNTDRCLMGYRYCEGEYCGKCHLKIRGWDISQMPV